MSPQPQDLYEPLNAGKAQHTFPFDSAQYLAPIARAYQWLNVAEAATGKTGGVTPQLCRSASDYFLGPCSDIRTVTFY